MNKQKGDKSIVNIRLNTIITRGLILLLTVI